MSKLYLIKTHKAATFSLTMQSIVERLYMKRWLIILALGLLVGNSYSQNTKLKEDGTDVLVDLEGDGPAPAKGYRSQFNIEVTAPHYFFNPANSQAFNGIIQANIWYSVKVQKNFYMGPFVKYAGFEYYAGRVNLANPLVTHINSGLQMSYEVKMGERFAYIPSLFMGFGYVQYNNLELPSKGIGDTGRNSWSDWGFAAQTNQSFYYYPTQNRKIAVGLVLGLSFNTHQFKLKETGLTSDASISGFSDNGPTLFGNIGFAMLMNFGKIR
jgi:hypothetical protein